MTNKVQYIRVMRTAVDGSDNALTMAELDAIDASGANVALNKPTSSSSTYYGDFPANLGNDGKLDNFMHTIGGDELGWWEVDLEGELDIRKIVIHNRIGSDPKRITGVMVALDSGRNELFKFNVQGVAGSQTFTLAGGNGETGNGDNVLSIKAMFGGEMKTLSWTPGIYSLDRFEMRDTIELIKALKNVSIKLYRQGKLINTYNLKKDDELRTIPIDIQTAEVMVISSGMTIPLPLIIVGLGAMFFLK